MPKTASPQTVFCFLNKAQLIKLKLKAVRAGVWFRALPRIDRSLVDLTIKVADSVRSTTLAKNILTIIRKLEEHLESSLSRAFRGVAHKIAQNLSIVAQKWGNTSAKNWVIDVSFIRFLAVMHINESKTFRA